MLPPRNRTTHNISISQTEFEAILNQRQTYVAVSEQGHDAFEVGDHLVLREFSAGMLQMTGRWCKVAVNTVDVRTNPSAIKGTVFMSIIKIGQGIDESFGGEPERRRASEVVPISDEERQAIETTPSLYELLDGVMRAMREPVQKLIQGAINKGYTAGQSQARIDIQELQNDLQNITEDRDSFRSKYSRSQSALTAAHAEIADLTPKPKAKGKSEKRAKRLLKTQVPFRKGKGTRKVRLIKDGKKRTLVIGSRTALQTIMGQSGKPSRARRRR